MLAKVSVLHDGEHLGRIQGRQDAREAERTMSAVRRRQRA